MSGGGSQLSLSEMRMLVTSAVHMDVSQIALCVVTIPKLKSAVQLLLNPPLPNKEYQPSVVAVNHPVVSMLWFYLLNY